MHFNSHWGCILRRSTELQYARSSLYIMLPLIYRRISRPLSKYVTKVYSLIWTSYFMSPKFIFFAFLLFNTKHFLNSRTFWPTFIKINFRRNVMIWPNYNSLQTKWLKIIISQRENIILKWYSKLYWRWSGEISQNLMAIY